MSGRGPCLRVGCSLALIPRSILFHELLFSCDLPIDYSILFGISTILKISLKCIFRYNNGAPQLSSSAKETKKLAQKLSVHLG